MKLQSTYGKLNQSSGTPAAVFTDVRSLPTDNNSRCSTMFLRSRAADVQGPGYTLSRGIPETLRTQHPGLGESVPGQQTVSKTGQNPNSREYENLPGTLGRGDTESAMYFVLERPPGYSDNN